MNLMANNLSSLVIANSGLNNGFNNSTDQQNNNTNKFNFMN